MTKSQTNTREIIMEGLLAVLEKGEYGHIVIGRILNKYSYLEKKERAFITRLMAGTIENIYLLDNIINSYSNTKTIKMKPVIRTILRMGIYQIYFMDGVADFAAINEAVNLTKKKGFKTLSGFVNGVLRSAARGVSEYSIPDEPCIKYSVPKWFYDMLLTTFGKAVTEKILKGFKSQNGVTVRMNLSKDKDADAIIKSLASQKIGFAPCEYMHEALILTEFDNLSDIKMLKAGYLQVQDLSSMFVALAAAPKKGDMVIDVCAAPGGKSLHIADKLMGTGIVEARDKSAYKLGMIEENVERTGLTNVRAKVWDALVVDDAAINTADIVIADLPCSGLGVIGKKPDIKYRVSREDIKALSELQRKILSVVHKYVKPGGTLVYSTCTLTKEENIENVNWFVSNYPFKIEEFEINIPSDTAIKIQGTVQILPSEITDGFFIARLKRID